MSLKQLMWVQLMKEREVAPLRFGVPLSGG